MTIHDTFAGAQYVTKIINLAHSMGVNLQVGSDFHEYSQIIDRHRPDQPLGLPFDPTLQGITAENGFWITGSTTDGRLVHTQAMRRFDLGGVNLSDYMAAHFRDFPPAGLALDLDASTYSPGPGAKRINGIACYHGEAWLQGGTTGFRGTGLAGALARFALATATLRWSPDYIFGFMPERHAFRGLVEREGYMHSDPGALGWHLAEAAKVLRGYMVWMGRDDLSHIMTLPAVDLAA